MESLGLRQSETPEIGEGGPPRALSSAGARWVTKLVLALSLGERVSANLNGGRVRGPLRAEGEGEQDEAAPAIQPAGRSRIKVLEAA
jgi:hypothetical protein